jgi:hypothetical protein
VPVKAVQARALNAQAWLLSRKLDRKAEADSLFWRVVREYPGTEAQLAARDYLEATGQSVPEKLIVRPKREAAARADSALTGPPATTPRLGEARLPEPGATRFGPGASRPAPPSTPGQLRAATMPDSLRAAFARRDSLVRALRDSVARDSARTHAAASDTSGRGSLMSQIRRQVGKVSGVVVAPDSVGPPDFSKVDSLAASRKDAALPSAPLPMAPRVSTPTLPRDTTRTDSTRTDSTRVVAPKSGKARAKSKTAAKPKSTSAAIDTTGKKRP